jgi:hypothetical protein
MMPPVMSMIIITVVIVIVRAIIISTGIVIVFRVVAVVIASVTTPTAKGDTESLCLRIVLVSMSLSGRDGLCCEIRLGVRVRNNDNHRDGFSLGKQVIQDLR